MESKSPSPNSETQLDTEQNGKQEELTVQTVSDPAPMSSPPRKTTLFLRLLPTLLLAGATGIWCFIGRIPIRVVGQSILIEPRSIVPFQNRGAGGQILELRVRPGDSIERGQILAVLDLPELQEKLATQQQKLAEYEQEDFEITLAQDRRTALLQQTLQLEGIAIPPQIQANEMQMKALDTELIAVKKQGDAYRERIEQLGEFIRLTEQRFESLEFLIEQGAVAPLSSPIVDSENTYQQSKNEQTSLFAKLEDLSYEAQRLRSQQIQLKAQNQELLAQLESLRKQSADSDLEDLKQNVSRRNTIDDLKRDIINLETQIATESKVVASHSGTIVTVSANPGQYVPIGSHLGTVRVQEIAGDSALTTFAFFTPEDASRIQAGMTAEMTPHLLTNRRFGGTREQFGYIPSKVSWVSSKTVTVEEVTSIVGDEDLAKSLVQNPVPYSIPDNGRAQNLPVVQVRLDLSNNLDTPTGFQWTQGNGPSVTLPEGTIGEARVTVEERSLASYGTAFLRWLTGVYDN
ncbi:MAG: NHLP bacteriocin system secretion protein [Cyanobacteria bacterium P01_H01_bin.15]